MARTPGSQFASASDDRKAHYLRDGKTEAVKFLQNQCRRWLAGQEPDDAIRQGIMLWNEAVGGCTRCGHQHIHGFCK